MFGMATQNPALLEQFLVVLAHNEHFLEYRSIVQQRNPRAAGIIATRGTKRIQGASTRLSTAASLENRSVLHV